MIIVQLSGGLGNQMFQYSLYRQLKEIGKKVKIDDMTCYRSKKDRSIQLSIFELSYERASKGEIIRMTDASMNPFLRLRRKLFGRRDLSYREAHFNYDPCVLQTEHGYLEGCFQTERYFKPVSGLLRRDFTFRPSVITKECKMYLEQIESRVSVSIHIRRGDYLSNTHAPVYGNICTEEYYEKAVSYMKETYPECVFFLFSNDREWTKDHFRDDNMIDVHCNNEETGYLDLFLMSRCRHNIIANSSFSWWAAWLNTNKEKCVIAPKRWINGRDCGDIYTENMLLR